MANLVAAPSNTAVNRERRPPPRTYPTPAATPKVLIRSLLHLLGEVAFQVIGRVPHGSGKRVRVVVDLSTVVAEGARLVRLLPGSARRAVWSVRMLRITHGAHLIPRETRRATR